MVLALSSLLLSLALQLPGETGVVRGQVRSEDTGSLVPGVTVEVVDVRPPQSAASGGDGRYTLSAVPAGRRTIRARRVGFAPFEMEVVVPAGRQVEVDIALRMTPIVLAPVQVGGRGRSAAADTTSAPAGELTRAGVRALQSSPGLTEIGLADAVARLPGQEPPDPSDVLFVRGTGADLKLVHLDGAPVYAPFPLGGLLEPFTPGLLNSAEVYLGGAPAKYDGGLSYILDLRTRASRPERFRSSGAMDLLAARAAVELPVAPGAGILLSGRSVHDGGTSWMAGDDLPYGYREGLARVDLDGGRAGSLSLTAFGNGERVWLDSIRTAERAIEWGNTSGSARYRVDLGATAFEVTAARGDFRARLPVASSAGRVAEGSSQRRRLAVDAVSGVGGMTLGWGGSFEEQRQEYRALRDVPVEAWQSVGRIGHASEAGVYADAGVRLADRVRARGGVRVDHFSLTDEILVAPRLAATVLLTERAALTLAAGRYHQYLRPAEEAMLADPAEMPVHLVEPLALARASHVSIALDQDVGDGVRLGLEGYFKSFDGIPGGEASNASASGMDLWVRKGTGEWRGWLGYSLAWTWSLPERPVATQFAGRHLLTSGVSAPLGSQGRLDLGFVYGAGLPYSAIPFRSTVGATPLMGERFADGGQVEPVNAGNAPLLPTPSRPYLRVDLGASRTWSPQWGRSPVEFTPYIRLLNTLGQRDALFYRGPASGEDTFRPVMILPVVPVVGLEWKF